MARSFCGRLLDYLLVAGVVVLGVVLAVPLWLSTRLRQWFFVHILAVGARVWRDAFEETRRATVDLLEDVESRDPQLREEGAIRVLEIGAGSGANFRLMRRKVKYWNVDPNTEFEATFLETLKKHPQVEMERWVAGYGEDMHDVPDKHFDVVLITHLLCSVDSVEKVLQECRRVLVQSGELIKRAGFAEVYVHETRVDMPVILSRHVYGRGCEDDFVGNVLLLPDVWPRATPALAGVKMALSESVGGGGDPSVQALRKCPVPGDYIASLCVRDAVNNSDGKFPSFREPREIGNFSLVGERREFVEGAVQMKYLRMPSHRHRLMWDLNVGFETAVRRDRSVNERLDSLLRWILRNRDKFALSSTGRPPSAETPPPPLENKRQGITVTDSVIACFKKCFRFETLNNTTGTVAFVGKHVRCLHTDFVCYRGLLTRLACTAFEAKEDWRVAACRHRGTVYLCAFETDAERQRRLDEEACPRRQRMSYWGYKFEQYMVSAEPGGAPDPEAVLNECEEYCVVVRSRLESHSLVFGAEVDAVDPRSAHHRHSSGGNKEAAAASTQPGSTVAYVELKTSRDCLSEQQYRNFCRFKLLKWWAQSFLVGIPRVVCGFRDDNGLIGTLEEFDVREMTHRAKVGGGGAL
ncbi:hypothetical protein HPB48_022241 [Haemaphysalis longicornis]|uniref:Decapping nuclease n=1 Tax=Haemaphysalis longicornis TaxID=44386 RepID=A0A9J6H4M4_HAELO|nr:hypothetical protein HPB48_022241 [Haemaphysalis longicornis]